MLRAAGCCSVRQYDYPNGRQGLSKLAKFAAWLPRHCGVFSSLAFVDCCDSNDLPQARALLTAALQRCAAQATALNPQAGGQRWSLHNCFLSAQLAGAAALEALEPAGLQALKLEEVSAEVCSPQLWAAIGQLTRLTGLTVLCPSYDPDGGDERVHVVGLDQYGDVAAAVGNLQSLISLDLLVRPQPGSSDN